MSHHYAGPEPMDWEPATPQTVNQWLAEYRRTAANQIWQQLQSGALVETREGDHGFSREDLAHIGCMLHGQGVTVEMVQSDGQRQSLLAQLNPKQST